jgi:hypothetical protein
MCDTSNEVVKSSVRVLTFVPDNLGALIVSDRRVENWVSAEFDPYGEVGVQLTLSVMLSFV